MGPRNTALQELQNLADIGRQGQADVANMAKAAEVQVGPDRQQPGEKKPSIMRPEALATAAGAAWVLGPGGLLIGLAQGILGKREEQRALDESKIVGEAWQRANVVYDDELERSAAAAQSPEDRDTLLSLKAIKDAGMELVKNPATAAQGAAMLQGFTDGLLAYQTKNEEQSIAADAERRRREAELNGAQLSYLNTLQSRFDAETKPQVDAITRMRDIRRMLHNGNYQQMWAASYMLVKTMDEGIVTDADIQGVKGTGDIKDKLGAWMGSFGLGDDMPPDTRRGFVGLLDALEDTATRTLQAKEAKYYDKLSDFGNTPEEAMPFRYYNDFNALDRIPKVEPGRFVEHPSLEKSFEEMSEAERRRFEDQQQAQWRKGKVER